MYFVFGNTNITQMAKTLIRNKALLFVGGFLVSIWIGIGCNSPASSNASDNFADSSESPVDLTIEPSGSEDNSTSERGLTATARVNFSFEKEFPQLFLLLKEQEDVLEKVSSYAQKALFREDIASETDLLALMEQRENEIIPLITPYFENMDPSLFQQKAEIINTELARLGMQITMAEGVFTGLGPSRMLSPNLRIQKVNTLNTIDAIQQYDAFTDARTQSMSGEYPYLDMEPYFDMLITGEQLKSSNNARIYYAKVEDNFRRALHVLTDIHVVTNEGGRVGGLHTEAYPYACDLKQMTSILNQYEESDYHSVIKNILDNPSEITQRPETIYLVVTEWADSEDSAENTVFEHLNNQKDIPHQLPVQRGDGKVRYAVVYRFYENEQQANQAIEKARTKGFEGELIMVSVQGNKLYQIGI